MNKHTVLDDVEASRQSDELVEKLRQELTADLLTADQVARVLKLERSTVLRYLRDHQLVGFQLGRQWMIPEAEVRAFVQRQADREREAAKLAASEAEVKRKFELWSKTKRHQKWDIYQCYDCGNNTLLVHDELQDRGTLPNGRELLTTVRVGKCEFCGYTTTISESSELYKTWASARRPQLETVVDQEIEQWVGLGLEAHKGECDKCGAPVVLTSPMEFGGDDRLNANPETVLTGKCENCSHLQVTERTAQEERERMRFENMPF